MMYLVFLYPTCTYVPTSHYYRYTSCFSIDIQFRKSWHSNLGIPAGWQYLYIISKLNRLVKKFKIPASLLWLVTKQCCVYLGVWWACFGAVMDRNWFQVPDSSELCRLPGFAFEKLLYFLFAYMVLLFCSCTHPMQVRKAGGGAYWSPWWHQ